MDGCGLENEWMDVVWRMNGWMWFGEWMGEWIDVVWRMDGCSLGNGWMDVVWRMNGWMWFGEWMDVVWDDDVVWGMDGLMCLGNGLLDVGLRMDGWMLDMAKRMADMVWIMDGSMWFLRINEWMDVVFKDMNELMNVCGLRMEWVWAVVWRMGGSWFWEWMWFGEFMDECGLENGWVDGWWVDLVWFGKCMWFWCMDDG